IISGTSSSAVTPTTATLNGQVNPNLAPTSYRFQYGATPQYGHQTPLSESIGDDETDHPISVGLAGLEPETTYHFRVLAVNFNGVTTGPDREFSTPAHPRILSSSVSAIAQTTAVLE